VQRVDQVISRVDPVQGGQQALVVQGIGDHDFRPGPEAQLFGGGAADHHPDLVTTVNQFGNKPPESPEEEGAREPLTDIIEEKDRIRVIVELPGVEKDDIQLHVEDRLLDISVDREDRKFSKELELPSAVDPDSAQASYKNGVLEVSLTKVAPKKRGRPVKIDSK
jgi:HSP20 family protein